MKITVPSVQKYSHHPDNPQVIKALKSAEKICESRSTRMTRIRRRVLELLLVNEGPAKTYDLLAVLEKENASAKPPTVYRALEFLQENGLAHKIESQRSYIACTKPEQQSPCYFLVCRKCEEVGESSDQTITDQVDHLAKRSGFNPMHQHVEIHGHCGTCN